MDGSQGKPQSLRCLRRPANRLPFVSHSYTIFNPITQAEKCDKNGDYIRKWVPELKDVEGKAIFAPYDRLSKAEFDKLGYPKPHVNFEETAERAKERYKRAPNSGDI